jgi:hypothetical protein
MKEKVTYTEFLERVDKYYAQFKPTWRYGQAYFNVLSNVRSDVAETLRSSMHDPFHKDAVSEDTHKYVKALW